MNSLFLLGKTRHRRNSCILNVKGHTYEPNVVYQRIHTYFKTHSYDAYLAFTLVFPGKLTAETELLIRFKKVCEKLNYGFFLIDKHNIILNTELKGISIDQVDPITCIITMHNKWPKNSRHFTLITLWNPRRYHGLVEWNRTLTADGFLSAGSDSIDQFVKSQTNKPFFGPLNTTLDGPLLDFGTGRYQCFYIGTNWEKMPGNAPLSLYRKRIMEWLHKLDEKGMVSLYGPRHAWTGFKSYTGEIPFDGESIVHEIHQCGICLVLSGEAHIEDGVCSNRLFEGLAAGVPIITDRNPFMEKWFGDSLFYIDSDSNTDSDLKAVEQIQGHVEYIQTHPQETFEKWQKSRDIFLKHFLMSQQLKQVTQQVVVHQQVNMARLV